VLDVDPPPVCDVVIIGAGCAGLTAAYALARGGAHVVVFERATLGDAASARNAGFCTISPPFSATNLVDTEGLNGARAWLQWFCCAVDRVLALVGQIAADDGRAVGFRRVGRLRLAETDTQASGLRHEADVQARRGLHVRFVAGKALEDRLPVGRAIGAIVDDVSASLNPGALLDALAAAAQKAGALIVEHCRVRQVTNCGSETLQVVHARGTTTARTLIVATNGYTDETFPPFRNFVLPVGSFIIVTEPVRSPRSLGDLDRVIVASTSYRFSHYFRLLDGRRLLFGGRASLALQTELNTCAEWLVRRASTVLAPLEVGACRGVPGWATGVHARSATVTRNARPSRLVRDGMCGARGSHLDRLRLRDCRLSSWEKNNGTVLERAGSAAVTAAPLGEARTAICPGISASARRVRYAARSQPASAALARYCSQAKLLFGGKPMIKRYGADGSKGIADQRMPFAHAVQADGWLYVSSQVGMVNGELVHGIVEQSGKAILNLLEIVENAGYNKADIVRCGVWLSDARNWPSFNRVFAHHFGEVLPARTCIIAGMVVDCLVEIDCVAYRSKS
jgi:glycine/D-amino acid oxidase-like deaminating enzyme/enamine deaminase RidA (YjgF/YER057c/UK114 family)